MSTLADDAPRGAAAGPSPLLFGAAVFLSAALVFIVQPMVARMILPKLGGSSAVWNTSLAFFQAALLAGYAYAHLLQRIPSLRGQMVLHLGVLALAGLVLPLQLSGALGDPAVNEPALWLAGVLALSIGAPFAALSATAPLIQAWYARTHGMGPEGRDPYVLYAASNLGSLLALLAYPVLVEPLVGLGAQSAGWSVGYVAFAALVAVLIAASWRSRSAVLMAAYHPASPAPSWSQRLVWLLLAAAPCSLLLGVTGHITSDVASAPFLWVVPLALYLVTFIIAFQARPLIPALPALILQAAMVPAALLLFSVPAAPLILQLPLHLTAFFLTALVCAQALAARRPHPDRLTEFYLWMSLGGVIGGSFNAFIAPIIFNGVWEYPIVLVLACLARPSQPGRMSYLQWVCLVVSLAFMVLLITPVELPRELRLALLFTPAVSALILRGRTWALVAVLGALAAASYLPDLLRRDTYQHRSFFGVVKIAEAPAGRFGPVRMMIHGSTLHGTQAQDPALSCRPTTYYAPNTPIGQVMRTEQGRRTGMSIGAVGLGTGTVAAYVRPTDRLRFFEIDPLVVRIAFNPAVFSYVNGCAKGPIDLTLGDARLSLESQPSAAFDVLLIDAFSSDSVPTHLMTVEAIRTYLRVIKPDGVVIMHLSNRNLELSGPAAAAAREAGGVMLEQSFYSDLRQSYIESSSQVLIVARNRQALQPYLAQPAWELPDRDARAWTDDYINVAGALVARTRIQHGW
jgi:SAM-dependent methyltransferase